MSRNRVQTFLLAVIALALVVQVIQNASFLAPATAQPVEPNVPGVPGITGALPGTTLSASGKPVYRGVIIDRYESPAEAERNMQLRLLEGYEIITLQVIAETIGERTDDAGEQIRVGNLFLAPINNAWVVVYGRV